MSWKPYWNVRGEGDKHCQNAQVFATEGEAKASAASRYMRWTATTGYGVDESDEPVNYRWDDESGDVFLDSERKAS